MPGTGMEILYFRRKTCCAASRSIMWSLDKLGVDVLTYGEKIYSRSMHWTTARPIESNTSRLGKNTWGLSRGGLHNILSLCAQHYTAFLILVV